MLLPWSHSHRKLPLLLRLSAKAWPLGGVGEHLQAQKEIGENLPRGCVALGKPTTSGRNHQVG